MTGGGSRVGESVDYDRWWIKGTYGVGESLEMSIHQPDMGKGRRHSCLLLFFAGFLNYSYYPHSIDHAYEEVIGYAC